MINKVVMKQQQKCSQCLELFTQLNAPRSMPSCEHNICTRCLKQVIQQRQQFIDCGFCAKKIKRKDIKLFPKNVRLIQKIRLQNISPTSIKLDKSISHPNAILKSEQPPKQDEQLLITLEQPQPTEDQNQTICEIHKKPLDIICATERKRICPHCAIFGNHKDHRFKTIFQFETEIKQKAEQFHQITQKKQENQALQKFGNLKQIFHQKVHSRKQLLLKQIEKSFNEFIDSIKMMQKSLKSQLEQKFKTVESKINENLSNQTKLKRNYIIWQSSCQDVINRLKMTKNPKKRVQIYYDSPLQICEEGKLHFNQMTKNLQDLFSQLDDSVNAISIKTQQKNIDGFVTLVFPMLEQNMLTKQIEKIQQSFDKDFPFKIQPPTRQDLEENSFISETQVSTIQPHHQPTTQKKHPTNKLNKSVSSINSITNLSIFNTPAKHKNPVNYERQRQTSLLNKTHSVQRRFGSPDFSRMKKSMKQNKTPEEILISLATNDFINEIDLSDLSLGDKEIYQFLYKAKKIRPLKAIKLQSNNLTDDGFQKICSHLQHVSNLNLSHNKLTDRCLDILLRNKDYLYKLRIINLSHNKLTSDRTDLRIKGKLEEIKKLGTVVSL